MTVRTIITRAGRIIQEVTEGAAAPTAWLSDEVGLNAFNAMMKDMRGAQIGQRLARDFAATAGDTAQPGGIYNCNVYAPAEPFNGDRFRVIGARTVTASDDTIQAAASVTTTVSTSWMYREDAGNWQKEEDLTLDDASPLQDECDEALAFMTAARMYIEQFGDLSAGIAAGAEWGRNRIRQLYFSRASVSVDNALLRGMAQRRFV
jgi:hypothetical protein